jgi:hypothetical protein
VWTVTRGPGMPGSTSSTLDLVADVTAAAAVPEPSSFAVLGVALAGLGLVWRRRRPVVAAPRSRSRPR